MTGAHFVAAFVNARVKTAKSRTIPATPSFEFAPLELLSSLLSLSASRALLDLRQRSSAAVMAVILGIGLGILFTRSVMRQLGDEPASLANIAQRIADDRDDDGNAQRYAGHRLVCLQTATHPLHQRDRSQHQGTSHHPDQAIPHKAQGQALGQVVQKRQAVHQNATAHQEHGGRASH